MSESIQDIKSKFNAATEEQIDALIELYKDDERNGVTLLIKRAKDKRIQLKLEDERIDKMMFYEKKYNQYPYICGIDEAGRGPLAGPVVAGAVILPKDFKLCYINDSKKLSSAKREALYASILTNALSFSTGVIDAKRIDEINILQATYEAMKAAVDGLNNKPDILLNDAVTIPAVSIPQENIIRGDAKSVSIAAASILAKVTRDRMMEAYDQLYPAYGFKRHKGYGTQEHIEALRRYGATPIHRRTFIGHFV